MKKAFIVLLLLSCTFVSAKSLKIMQYNGENFFDTSFDQGTDDYTYLPLAVKKNLPGHGAFCETMSGFYKDQCFNMDWNETKFAKKVQNVARVIKAYDQSGLGPDVLFMEEIENINVLNQVALKGLTGLGYNYRVLIEGDDMRGIDVGIISKYPVISSKHHSLIIDGQKIDTRGILEVTLNVEGKSVVLFANHWPSQSNPTLHRIESAKLLQKLADNKKADLIIAAGDFNTLDTEKPAPFSFLSNFVDSEKEARKVNSTLNPGTHFYRSKWSSLDRIFIHKKSTMVPDYKTYQIMKPSFMLTRDSKTGTMIPMRTNFSTGEGYSDHLPIGIIFNY